ncbi:hypothetical protein [Argonema antarcticum]|uniref:hypothetical protein n=1 Tax=Argonema antarcticum TaxID=2942763 RepID=UPI0020127E18|nr:hypothetical protein [Argonema antarcticum]MCL1474628.1 hypothetical protein [Argonema antarcticum A004/B2]
MNPLVSELVSRQSSVVSCQSSVVSCQSPIPFVRAGLAHTSHYQQNILQNPPLLTFDFSSPSSCDRP